MITWDSKYISRYDVEHLSMLFRGKYYGSVIIEYAPSLIYVKNDDGDIYFDSIKEAKEYCESECLRGHRNSTISEITN